jgi:hypothetical protein
MEACTLPLICLESAVSVASRHLSLFLFHATRPPYSMNAPQSREVAGATSYMRCDRPPNWMQKQKKGPVKPALLGLMRLGLEAVLCRQAKVPTAGLVEEEPAPALAIEGPLTLLRAVVPEAENVIGS